MKTLKWISMVTVSMGMAGALVAPPAIADSGKGWDMFNSGQGERIGPAASGLPASSGFDIFQMGLGEPIRAVPYQGAAQSRAGQGWDMYQTGSGEPIR